MSNLAINRQTVGEARAILGTVRKASRRNPLGIGIEALAERYAIVAAILGRAPFLDLASDFIAESVPDAPTHIAISDRFPDWINMRRIGRILPYLSAVAAIDRLRRETENAAAEMPVTPAHVAALTTSQWARSKARIHSATRFGWFSVPAPSIWLAHYDPSSVDTAPEWQAEGILITRPGVSAQARRIGRAEHRILAGLRVGETIGAAADAAHALYPDANITGAFHALIDSGALSSLKNR